LHINKNNNLVRKKIFLLTTCSLLNIFLFAQNPKSFSPGKTSLQAVPFAGIKGKIFDNTTGANLSARIVISDDSGNISNSYYKALPGFFTEEDGTFEELLKPGNYSMSIFHGIDYESQKMSFTIKQEEGFNAQIYLKPWSPLKKKGWVCGDGHDHLYTDKKPDTAMVATLRKICLAQGIDFVCAAQGWAGYNDTTWRNGYARYSDNNFTISYGSEMPKYRTGHTWWLGQTSTRNYFENVMDTSYENHYYQIEQGTTWNFKELTFPFIPDVEVVERFKTADYSIAVMAHPTSWWWQKRGSVEKYVTNVAANLSFGLLAGKIWDGIVVMGYNHDHYFYQNLWFHILNEGYRMPVIAELDGGFEKDDNKYYGSMRTYSNVPGKFSINKLTDAVRKGRTFITSGPVILADVDNKYEIGDVVTINGEKHNLHISAYASGEQDDYLSYIIVYRNGKVFKIWDIRNKRLREFKTTFAITEKEKAWYIIKVYGKSAWKNPEHLDVMRVCDKGPEKNFSDDDKSQKDVAITSPFYFWRPGVKEPKALISKVRLTVIAPSQKQSFKNVTVNVLVNGKNTKTIYLKNGKVEFTMPVNGLLKISAEGYTPVYRTLYLDYPPQQQLLEELATGHWLKKYDSTKFTPGEVPWKEFHFEKTKQVLSNVEWKIEFTPNERDDLWQNFEAIFATDDKRQ
jgi:hypothetical protein